jgi:hypothetical protein
MGTEEQRYRFLKAKAKAKSKAKATDMSVRPTSAPVMTRTGAFVITEREFQGMQVECLY